MRTTQQYPTASYYGPVLPLCYEEKPQNLS